VAGRPRRVLRRHDGPTWTDNRAAIEEYLRTAEVTKTEEIGVGVTKPMRAWLAPGGPVSEMAWKTIKPGRHGGFWESYRNEIAAYELDKFLGLDMVPPTVEREVKGESGAAIMWVSPTESFKKLGGVHSPPGKYMLKWNRQMSRAKLFHNLVGNIDPNHGNWLIDPEWNLILIDHTRAFTSEDKLVHQMQLVDLPLWTKMKELSEESLQSSVGQWLGKGEIRGMLKRRDKMAQEIDRLVKKSSEAAVFLK
jgi:hypothetical protein